MVPLNLLATARSLLRWPVSSPPILPPTSSTGASLSEEWVRSGQDHPVLVCVYYCRTYYLVLDRMDGPSYFFLQVCSEGTRGPVHTVPGVRVDNWLRTLPQRQRPDLCFLLCRQSAKIFGPLLVTSCLEENYNPLETGRICLPLPAAKFAYQNSGNRRRFFKIVTNTPNHTVLPDG